VGPGAGLDVVKSFAEVWQEVTTIREISSMCVMTLFHMHMQCVVLSEMGNYS
jgi:hypothetical protein